jgi:hypothetical protein
MTEEIKNKQLDVNPAENNDQVEETTNEQLDVNPAENNDQVEETVQENLEEQVNDTPSNLDENVAIAKDDAVSEQNKLNIKAMREAKRKAEQERDELLNRIKELETSKNKFVDDDDDLYEDDITKTKKELQELKSQWQAQQNQAKVFQIEQKLKAGFPDLEQVVNDETIEVLKARDKSFAKIIDSQPQSVDELYNRAVSAYALIKKYGIYVEDNHKADRARVEKNMSKPRPVSTAAATPSEGLADFAQFAHLNDEERSRAINKLARQRAGLE